MTLPKWEKRIIEKYTCRFCEESFRTNFQLKRHSASSTKHNDSHNAWLKAAKYVDSNFAEQEEMAKYYGDQEKI